MELIEILSPDFHFEDGRGAITQIVSGGFKQINAVYTKKGAVRGNFHCHKSNKEVIFIICGGIKLKAELGENREQYVFGTGDMFLIKENVRHSFEFTEDTYLVGLYSGCVELPDGTKDIFLD